MANELSNHDASNPEDESRLIEKCKPAEHNQRSISTTVEIIEQQRFRLTVEPVIFLYMTASMLPGTLLTNLLLIRSCQYLKLDNCSSIDTQSGGSIEKEVQPYVAELGMYRMILESLPPTLMAFFIGSWSDTYGRRPILIACIIGSTVQFVCLTLFTVFNLEPMFVLLTSVPSTLAGGSMIFFTGAFSYINDVCPKKDLAFRMACCEGTLYIAILCGNTAGPFLSTLFPTHGYEFVFGISFLLCCFALIYVLLFLPESIPRSEHTYEKRLRALFDIKNVVEPFRVCFHRRDDHSRAIRLLMIGMSFFSLIALEGTIAVLFLFTRSRFSWDIKDFTYYSDAVIVMKVCGSLLGTVAFTKWFKLPDAPVSCVGAFLEVVSDVIAGLGSSGWYMYLSGAVSSLGRMSSPLNRAILARTVPKQDMGKLSAITSALMTAVPLVAGPTYTVLYTSTISTFPGAVFFLSAALVGLTCFMTGVVAVLQKLDSSNPFRLDNVDNVTQDDTTQYPVS